jgi:hypothetical protein
MVTRPTLLFRNIERGFCVGENLLHRRRAPLHIRRSALRNLEGYKCPVPSYLCHSSL